MRTARTARRTSGDGSPRGAPIRADQAPRDARASALVS